MGHVLVLLATVLATTAPHHAAAAGHAAAKSGFVLTSNDMRAGGTVGSAQVFNNMGCTGENISPDLEWTGAPANTKSYAITLYDPDAPTGSGWWHWVVYNLPASTTRLPSGAGDGAKDMLPAGTVQGTTDFGTPGYGGPCPPQGDKPHRYIFTVFALDTDKLEIPANATAAYVGANLHAHQLGKATLTAKYGR